MSVHLSRSFITLLNHFLLVNTSVKRNKYRLYVKTGMGNWGTE